MTATVLAKPLAPQAAATASFTAVGGRIYPVNATSADITAALPQNARAGTTIVITRADSSSHVVTINRGGTDTISSGTGTVTSLTLSGQGAAITLVSDGAGHWTITQQTPGNGTYAARSAPIVAALIFGD